jgi:Protein of unknown function (DUF1566)
MSKRSSFPPSFSLIALALLAACSEVNKPATAALVVVRADDDLATNELARLEVRVYPAGASQGSTPSDQREFELDRDPLPFSFGIEKATAQRFLLVVDGFRAGDTDPVIERKVLASFKDRQTVLVEVVLTGVCFGRADECSSLDETCYVEASAGTPAGACGEVVEAPARAVDPGQELDAAAHPSMDAGGSHPGSSRDASDLDGAGPEDAGEAGGDDEAATVRCEAPCQNGGTCRASGASRTCDCSAVDYEGPSCGIKIDDCARSPCANGATCTDGVRARTCACPPGTSGPDCAPTSPSCSGANVCAGAVNGVSFGYPCADTPSGTSKYRCIGQFPDGVVSSSVPSAGRFSASDGVVTDAQTGLRWQQVQDPNLYPWAEAKTYCSRLELAGGDWRLPSRAELTTLVHYGRVLPTIDAVAFPDTSHDAFWTSSPFVGEAGQAWVIYFSYGGTNDRATSESHYVRCVR